MILCSRRAFLASSVGFLGCRRAPDAPFAAANALDAGDLVEAARTDAAIPRRTAGDAEAARGLESSEAARAVEATPAKLMPDEAVGPLVARLSENPGTFPSENYVSNEASLLDVASALRDAKLRGHAYVGVGPEQNYTYLAMLEPPVAYIVDIRRDNLLEHMVFRGCFEVASSRAEFLSALLARPAAVSADGGASDPAPGFAALAAIFRSAGRDHALRDAGITRTKALLDRLGIVHSRADDATIARICGAFATHGLSIAYTMTGEPGAYPTLGETLSLQDPSGEPASFLATEASYARVRRLVVENRVLPVVGDFGGTHALRAVGDDMRARGASLGVFYTSNVEQYLFDSHRHAAFLASVTSMPRDEASRFVRVWFDRDQPKPSRHPKHRTTQLTTGVNAFLARAAEKPFRTYRETVSQPP